jgi:hypothetical protein
MKSLRWQKIPVLSILLIFLPVVWLGPLSAQTGGDQLNVAGIVSDAKGKGISGVRVEVLVNGRTMPAESPETMVTDKRGSFLVKIPVPAGVRPPGQVELRASKPSWKTSIIPVQAVAKGAGQTGFQALGRLTPPVIISLFWLI